jgi:hypothetical protein
LKKLLSVWLKYVSLATYKLDDHVAKALGVILNQENSSYTEALPLCILNYKNNLIIVRKVSGVNFDTEEDQKKADLKRPLLNNKEDNFI